MQTATDLTTSKGIQKDHQPDQSLSSPAYIFLVLLWILGGLILFLPVANTFSLTEKIQFLAPAVLVSVLLVLINPMDGFALWTLGLTFLISQTGFQVQVGPILTSALELVLVFLLVALAWSRKRFLLSENISFHVPGQKYLALFIILSGGLLAIGLLRGDSPALAIQQLKGFVLYPLMAYVLLAGIRSEKMLRWSTYLLVGWYIFVAGHGLMQFSQGQSTSVEAEIFRADSGYSAINLFGVTLAAIALLVAGLTIHAASQKKRMLGTGVAAWLFLGSLTSVSRTGFVAFALGLLVLLALSKTKKRYIFALALAAIAIFYLLPDSIAERIFQLSDSSTQRREFYLQSGLQAFKTYWPTGAGWGKAFWYDPLYGLIPSASIPWYHNDYLNLAVQAGIAGLALYLAFWWQVLRAGYRWLGRYSDSRYAPYVRGSLAALAGLLAAALFEHVLWRPDIAGLTGWTAGIMIAAMHLGKRSAQEPTAE